MKSVAVTSRALDQNGFSLRKCQLKIGQKDVSERHLKMVFALKGAYSVWGLIYFDMNFCCHGIKVYFWNCCSANVLKSLLYEFWPKEVANITMKW